MKIWKMSLLVVSMVSLSGCALMGYRSSEPKTSQQAQIQSHGLGTHKTYSSYGAATPSVSNVIYFGFNRFSLDYKAEQTAHKTVRYLLAHSAQSALLAGYTDPRGSQSYNFHLGQRRADAVKQYLIAQGVPAHQLCTVSYGELKPAATPAQFGGDWQKAYALDRRVEVMLGQQVCNGKG